MDEIICSICCDSVRLNTRDKNYVPITTNLIIPMPTTQVCMLLCNHLFHSDCLLKHLNIKRNCPNCRSLVAVDKMIFIPDALITIDKVEQVIVDLERAKVGIPQDQALARLHKDLQRREDQIEELQLQLENRIYPSDDEDDILENRAELETTRFQNLELRNEILRLKAELDTLKHSLERANLNLKDWKNQSLQKDTIVRVFKLIGFEARTVIVEIKSTRIRNRNDNFKNKSTILPFVPILID